MTTVIIVVVLVAIFGVLLLKVRHHYMKLLKRANKRAQQSAHMKAVYIDNISRNFRNPLNAISEVLDKILTENDDNLQPTQVKQMVTTISNTTKELKDFVEQLREMTKVEGDSAKVSFIEVNLYELMASYQREGLHHAKPEVNIRVSTDLSHHCRAIIDTNLMHQLMMYLLKNATDHVHAGDIFIKYSCERRGLKVSISYIDYDQFEPMKADIYTYLQDDEALKKTTDSSVLGLALCKAIVDMFAGEFYMGYEDGKKSVASFWFPCKMKDVYKDL